MIKQEFHVLHESGTRKFDNYNAAFQYYTTLEGEAYIVSYHYNHYDGCQDYRIVEEKNVQLG